MVLVSGYVQGIVRMPDPPLITIRTSLPLLFANENSFKLDKNADLESIDAYMHFITTSGSCYKLGTKKDTSELLDYVHRYISIAPSPIQYMECTIKKRLFSDVGPDLVHGPDLGPNVKKTK
jgi:hypothetical protein